MKLFLAVLLFFFSSFGFIHADSDNTEDESTLDEYFYVGFGGLIDLSGQNSNNYSLGGGAELITGYCFSDHVSAQIRADGFYFYGTGKSSIYDYRPTFELKFAMDLHDFFQPYFFFGPGADIRYNVVNNMTTSSVSLMAVGGLGVQFELGDQINFFVEGKYNFIFQNASVYGSGGLLQDIPAEAGITLGL